MSNLHQVGGIHYEILKIQQYLKIKLNAKSNGNGKLKYKVSKYPKGTKKFITISKKGIITLKKKAKKGIYKITITAAEIGEFKRTTKVVSINVK